MTEKTMVKPEKRKLNTFDNMDYLEILKVTIRKLEEEKSTLEQRNILLRVQQTQTEENIKNMKSNFESWKKAETNKFENERQNKWNEFAQRDHALRQGEQNITKRIMEVAERERRANEIDEIRKKLATDRIQVEKLKSQAEVELRNATTMKSEAQSRLNEVSIKEKAIADKLVKISGIDSDFKSREAKIALEKSAIEERIKNLEEIKANLDPKLKEIEDTQENSKKVLAEAQKLERDAGSKLEENKQILSKINEKMKWMNEKEIDIVTREEEVRRREILLDERIKNQEK